MTDLIATAGDFAAEVARDRGRCPDCGHLAHPIDRCAAEVDTGGYIAGCDCDYPTESDMQAGMPGQVRGLLPPEG